MRPVYLHIAHSPEIGVREILKTYYGTANVFDAPDADLADFLLNEPERFDDYLAFAGPFHSDDFQSFSLTDIGFFSVIHDPAVRAWNEYISETRRCNFSHWLQYDSKPNTVCSQLTGLKNANQSDFQGLLSAAHFMACADTQAATMLNALGRLYGWSQLASHSSTPIALFAPQTPEIPGELRKTVKTYHRPDYDAYQWLLNRPYTF